MYFASRLQAGRMLAAQLVPKYRYENCAVVALNDGGVMVGAQLATQLHCVLMMVMSEQIELPRENMPIGGITSEGTFSYNQQFSDGEISELESEYHGVIEQEKLLHLHKMHELLGSGGMVRRDLLRGHNVILVADGLQNGFLLEMAAEFLKPIAMEKLIVAVPFASVSAVDRMHILADEIYCLNVIEDYISTEHYYEAQDVPDHATVIKTIENIVLHWK
ncbi:MAG TPA: phosphoribosyltransferase family protein [Candidatus Saccharimonadales bacterium]|nr:phosphoribosyltransferase family protein [Candidatus Saccharimonadales bacterium]